MTVLDRPNADDMVPFPAFIPRPLVSKLFKDQIGIDFNRKLYESPNGRALILYCLAGREILVATLKSHSPYLTVQDALASAYPKALKFQKGP
eukprot:CAMPEP_0170565644 /NCGR_PEP_ID=MMETSP0211-20121228/79324_1 /TAXON_ID=311385 /ORGANISM="Pseudokeronopsis sp., Strain OXSARD2" /LENGTH=91 /DNA_ID=CAMNT_0010886581 /DNA_START=1621 /DNA_END=1896 /DNA_ORIENTATION=-